MKTIILTACLLSSGLPLSAFELNGLTGAQVTALAAPAGLELPGPAARGLEDDMPHGGIPGWSLIVYDWEDNRPLTRPGELRGGNYAEKAQAESAMRTWVSLLNQAGIQPKSYGVSAVTGRPWKFTVLYGAEVRLACAGAGAFAQYQQARSALDAAYAKYEGAGKKVVALMIANFNSSATPYYAWVYYLENGRAQKSSVDLTGVSDNELLEGWAELRTSFGNSVPPASAAELAGEYESFLYYSEDGIVLIEKLLVKIFKSDAGVKIIFPMPPYGKKETFPVTTVDGATGFDSDGDGALDLELRRAKGGWLTMKTDLYGQNSYGFTRKIWD